MKEFVKRFAPFFLTFALGMFLASLFLPVSPTNVNYNQSWKHREHKRTQCENRRLRKQLKELKRNNPDFNDSIEFLDVPPPPPAPPAPPAPPRAR